MLLDGGALKGRVDALFQIVQLGIGQGRMVEETVAVRRKKLRQHGVYDHHILTVEGREVLIGRDNGQGRKEVAVESHLIFIGRRQHDNRKVLASEVLPAGGKQSGRIGVDLVEQRIVHHAVKGDERNEVVVAETEKGVLGGVVADDGIRMVALAEVLVVEEKDLEPVPVEEVGENLQNGQVLGVAERRSAGGKVDGDQAFAVGDKRLGSLIRCISQKVNDLKDLLTGWFRDPHVGAVVDNIRDSGDGNPGLPCDIFDGDIITSHTTSQKIRYLIVSLNLLLLKKKTIGLSNVKHEQMHNKV